MLSFVNFARNLSRAFSRSDRRRSKVSTYRATEVLEIRAVLTDIDYGAMMMAMTSPPAANTAPAIDYAAIMMMGMNSPPGGNTNPPADSVASSNMLASVEAAAANNNNTNTTQVDASIFSISAVVNGQGGIDVTVMIANLPTGASTTIEFTGAVTGEYTLSNGSNVLTFTTPGSGSASGQLKTSTGTNIGSAVTFTAP